ncbi:MAG: hypothetical protein COV74_00275 [Candidatus Omnitrophica bacterium CG11_big_fil_rev_8_21_14_0_20_45_26]|uniref:Uncharacterized protein n=1 Tax=Candidatus Abzuiibacterium crystallinum TaxID=1974748 RepID=A0A2H0LT04_9BACT|nr:MAG: hypothetical protein COV74_00275 [Candidatus Omnitrophica bacterium CG11_big_fil_rev_8_21_14_0_20_45_26]PIW64626.1 MAG: hypothetical protein COW12_05505 [Candidatus Omnitrophica bacterium CG12_big_fil_rev_8_21_14_0_65_45_16]
MKREEIVSNNTVNDNIKKSIKDKPIRGLGDNKKGRFDLDYLKMKIRYENDPLVREQHHARHAIIILDIVLRKTNKGLLIDRGTLSRLMNHLRNLVDVLGGGNTSEITQDLLLEVWETYHRYTIMKEMLRIDATSWVSRNRDAILKFADCYQLKDYLDSTN